MKTTLHKPIIFIILLISAAFVLQACAMFHFKPAEDVIRGRVSAMMDAKVNNDWGKVYDYFAPEYKKIMSKENFEKMNRSIYFTSYKIASIEIQPSGKEAKVVVTYSVTTKGFNFPNSKETQTWLKSGWNWYLFVPQPSDNPLAD